MNRVYDTDAEDTFGPGFFILEIDLEQVVYVTSTDLPSLQEVTSIVERGFSRGFGGRVRFRTLLQQNVAFNTILTVEVLDGTLSAPQAAPSAKPSGFPSQQPSLVPSMGPTSDKSQFPSGNPSLTSSSLQPSSDPIESFKPTESKESDVLDRAQDTDDEGLKRLPLILGAIGGGLVCILVSCFFICCVWLPYCKKRPKPNSTPAPQQSNGQGDTTIGSSHVDQGGGVSFTDESSSLANTTIGERTIGRFFGRGRKVVEQKDAGPINSFDENSMYTTAQKTDTGNDSISYESSMILAPSVDQVADFEDDFIIPMDDDEESEDLENLGLWQEAEAETSDGKSIEKTSNLDVLEFSEEEGSNDPFVDSDEDSMEGRRTRTPSPHMAKGTIGLDPVSAQPRRYAGDEYSSSTYSSGRSDSHDFSSTQSSSLRSSYSTEDDGSHTDKGSVSMSKASKGSLYGSDSDSKSLQSTSSVLKTRRTTERMSSAEKESNNSLLRSVLEDAQMLAQSSVMSVISRPSVRSAPPLRPPRPLVPRDPTYRKGLKSTTSRTKGPASSKSVGSSPHPRSFRKDKGEKAPRVPTRISRQPVQSSKTLAAKVEETDNVNNSEKAPLTGMSSTKATAMKIDITTASNSQEATNAQTILQQLEQDYKTKKMDAAKDDSTAQAQRQIARHKQDLNFKAFLKEAEEEDLALLETDEEKASPLVSPGFSYLKNLPMSPPALLGATAYRRSVTNDTASTPELESASKDSFHCAATPRMHNISKNEDESTNSSLMDIDSVDDSEKETGESQSDIPSEDSVIDNQSEETDTPLSSPSILGPFNATLGIRTKGMLEKDDDASSDSDGLSNPWLFDTLEQALGPRSVTADMESISGKSTGSNRSHRSHRSVSSAKSTPRKRRGRSSHSPEAEQKTDSEGIVPDIEPRSLEHDLKRLQQQLADVIHTGEPMNATNGSVASATGSTRSAKRVADAMKSKKRQVVVVVPPGKLGVVLANRHDGNGAVVAEVNPGSSMTTVLTPGDKLVAVNGQDVTKLAISDITKIMAAEAEHQRKLTIITHEKSSKNMKDYHQESKQDY